MYVSNTGNRGLDTYKAAKARDRQLFLSRQFKEKQEELKQEELRALGQEVLTNNPGLTDKQLAAIVARAYELRHR